MADAKISALTALAGASIDVAADVLAIVDTSVTTTKKTTPTDLATAIAATQAQQETGTSLATAVSPGTQHFHPSAPKAWGMITTPTTTTAIYPIVGVVIVKNGTGDYTITHGRTFSTANYAAQVNGAGAVIVSNIQGKTATTLRVTFTDVTGTLIDPSSFDYVLFGDL